MRQRRIAASLAIVLALGAAPALAQQDQHHPAKAPPASAATPPPTTQGMPMGSAAGVGGGMPMMGMMGMMTGQDGMGGMARMATAMAEHVEGRLAFLKTELKITDAQLPLWNTFAQALRDNAKTMGSMMQGGGKQGGMMGMNQSATLPEKLATREKMMTAHLEGLHKLKAAVDPLYAALTEEQKKTADQLMLSPMGMM